MLEADLIMGYEPTLKALGVHRAEQSALHEHAAAMAVQGFGRRVFVRAVVEVSNFCRDNCHYCGMRRDNHALTCARASHSDLAESLIHKRPMAVTDINTQAGEDRVLEAIAAEGLIASPQSLASSYRSAAANRAARPPVATAPRSSTCPARSF
jgi:2-iminoacetate synthase ThiH